MNGWGHHGRHRKAAGFGLVMVLCMLGMACSPSTRYQVLTFLFDGVPPPPGVEPHPDDEPQEPERVISTFARSLRGIEGAAERAAPPPLILSVHQPYLDRKCSECHDMSTGTFDIAHDATLCDRCHADQRKEQDWDHGPINLGTCVPCHVPHQSTHKRLLYKAVPDLCYTCHVDVESGVAEYHDVPNLSDCVACHDPHRMY
jgi:predicted CXXCH cytochrome family protein